MFLLCLCIVLGIIIIILVIKLLLMKKAINEIYEDFSEKLTTDTNTLITISSHDKSISKLANEINKQLKEIQKLRHRYTQGDKELKNAVTNISHDLRTPLTAIYGYLDLLDKTEKSDTVEQYLDIIKNRIETLKQLTEELFRYSVLTTLEYDDTTESLNVNNLLEECIVGFYAEMQKAQIIPNINITETKVVRNLNRKVLSRVIANLITNALKYSDSDLEIILTENGELIFANTASKLNDVEVNRLFERFYTVENAKKSTGLGLSIAKILIEQMHGTIKAVYENGKLKIVIILPNT